MPRHLTRLGLGQPTGRPDNLQLRGGRQPTMEHQLVRRLRGAAFLKIGQGARRLLQRLNLHNELPQPADQRAGPRELLQREHRAEVEDRRDAARPRRVLHLHRRWEGDGCEWRGW